MFHITFGHTKFDTAILIKHAGLQEKAIRTEYLTPLLDLGMDISGTVAFSLEYDKKKPSAGCRKSYLEKLLPELDKLGVKDILCCDGEYFKTLVRETKAEVHLGYVLPCKIAGFEHMNVVYGFNHQAFFAAPDNRKRLVLALEALHAHKQGSYVAIGTNVLQEVYYTTRIENIKMWLDKLLEYPALTIDIEAFSLKHYSAGIGTLSFSWGKHSAVAFPVDAVACDPYEVQVWDKTTKKYKTKIAHIRQVTNEPVRALLKEFFTNYLGKMIWHNASYDAYVLIYQLWMNDLLDRKGLLEGLAIMTRNIECTQIITYLATNSCAGNKLGLKDQAHEFAGNYAVDVKDIRLQPLPDLLKYNSVDTCSTFFVWEKNYPKMVADDQEDIYINHFRPYLTDVIDMQLTGMCLDMKKVEEADIKLRTVRDDAYNLVLNSNIGKYFITECIKDEVTERNVAYKTKVIDASEANFKLNLNSGPQLQKLLYEFMELPVIDYTDSKQPATGNKTIKKLINHVSNISGLTDCEIKEYKQVLQAMIDFALADKIVTSFIRAFLEAPLAPDGNYYLYGSYKLGGTVSGRLSSCLVGETMVQCSDGIKRLDEINRGDLVPTHTGKLQPVLNVFNNGTQPVYRITLEDGKQLDCTSNHRLLTENGFLSLEDMFNENAAKIRQRFINGYAASFDGLPQLSVVGIAENSNWKEFKDSSSVSSTCQQRGTCSKENTYKSSYASATLCECTTSRNETLPSKYRVEFGRSSQRCKSTPICTSNLHKGTGGYYSVSESIIPETLLPENTTAPEREGCDQKKGHAKVYRPKGICTSTNSCLDGEREQVQLRAPSSNAKTPRVGSITKWVGGTSCQRGQDRQSSGQLSTDDQFSTHGAPPRKYSPIIKIDYVGVRRVYDLEVEADHCYIANGVYVHNSNPNMQNIPSGSFFAKLIKACFIAPNGYLFGGADSASLEDRIDALLTKDTNKIKVYTDGYDGHMLRAYHYWPAKFVGVPETPEAINALKADFSDVRDKSKPVTFALTYQGMFITLMNNCGFSETEAKAIEANYHFLYQESDVWKAAKIQKASVDGYSVVAFGLKVRTPLLNQVLLGNRRTPFEAQAEGRTVGNAFGQSYGLLNNRAGREVMEQVRASEYKYDIVMCAQIHDAIYFRWKDNITITKWLNDIIGKAMAWQDLPEIAHDEVHLSGELDIFYPSWKDPITLPNNITEAEIVNTILKEANKRKEKADALLTDDS